jgi:hypothetical protein
VLAGRRQIWVVIFVVIVQERYILSPGEYSNSWRAILLHTIHV